jgi:hypothetical protein
MRRLDAFGNGSSEGRANRVTFLRQPIRSGLQRSPCYCADCFAFVGFRSDKRYLVFQCLVHTADIGKVQVRLFALCHERRNLAEYEGYMDEDEALLAQLLESAAQLLVRVQEQMGEL